MSRCAVSAKCQTILQLFNDQNPIGQHFGPDKIKYSATYEIVGVTNDVR